MDQTKQPKGIPKGTRIILSVSDEAAARLKAAIARGDLKEFGITTYKELSPEEHAAIPEDQLETLEEWMQGSREDKKKPGSPNC